MTKARLLCIAKRRSTELVSRKELSWSFQNFDETQVARDGSMHVQEENARARFAHKVVNAISIRKANTWDNCNLEETGSSFAFIQSH